MAENLERHMRQHAERALAAQRSKQLRVFRKLDTLQAYLQEIGVVRFEIDAAGFVVAPRQR